ncbi:MAG: hypothetical protein LBK04_04070 [Clostridiales Family XIII bacterium]|jgi:hypothetical protein|nr:hypothetical protein [Clostridiales Family XIII bacterium]
MLKYADLIPFLALMAGLSLVCGLMPKSRPRLDSDRASGAFETFRRRLASTRKKLPAGGASFESEIYSSLSIMRTMAAGYGDGGALLSADTLMEHLISAGGAMSNALSESLGLLRLGRDEEAVERFVKTANTEYSRDFMLLIAGWDSAEPAKLLSAISSFREALKERRMTKLKKKAELMSDLLYLPVTVGALIVFLNFVFIAYYAEQQELLKEMFF